MGKSSALCYLGGEGLKKILRRQKKAGKEAKSFIFVLFEDKLHFAFVPLSPKRGALKETKGRERVSATSREN